jgi:hypothetical protein
MLSPPENQVKNNNKNYSAKAYIHFLRFKYDSDKNVPEAKTIAFPSGRASSSPIVCNYLKLGMVTVLSNRVLRGWHEVRMDRGNN